jgi:hypothetical protein
MVSVGYTSLTCAAAAGCCVLAVGCVEERTLPDPAPVVWVGERLELATNGEMRECGGNREYLDAFVGAALDDMGLETDTPIRYYLLTSEELREASDGWALLGARFASHNHAYTNVAVDTHELVHALRHAAIRYPLPGATFFEEGLAVMYQKDHRSLASDRDIMAALEFNRDLRAYIESEHYGVAGHFTQFLSGEHGVEAVAAYVGDQTGARNVEDLEVLFADHFGEPLAVAAQRYREEYPRCRHLARTRHLVECSQPPMQPVDHAINVSYQLACDDPDVLGPVDGRMWRSFTFDVPTTKRYLLHNAAMPFDFTLELVDCDRGCLGVDLVTSGAGTIYVSPDLEPGRYLVRLSREIESPGRVGVSIGRFD